MPGGRAAREDEAIRNAYKVNIDPANLLIDSEGRVVAEPILGNAEQERWLGKWIELLLAQRAR